MSLSPAAPPAQDEGARPNGPLLPPVEAPTGTFILQLFLIPLLIVSIVICVWLLFSWLAHMGRDNAADIASQIERGDNWSGQRAYELADMLRSNDPKFEALRSDAALARRLADFLARDMQQPLGRKDWRLVMRRMYLCRALGSFKVADGLPVLIAAARQQRDPVEVEVRLSALEAIATLADQCGVESFRENEEVLSLLLEMSQIRDDGAPLPTPSPENGAPTLYRPTSELRAVAAYALGVVGGDQATERLRRMLRDPYPNARYNAATGLARTGDPQCQRVLQEMLDPDNDAAVRDERYPDDQARKRTTVLLNGIKATLLLAQTNPSADISRLKEALQNLTTSPLEKVAIDRSRVKTTAQEALRLLDDLQPARKRG